MSTDYVPEMFVVDKCIEQGREVIQRYEASSAPVKALKDFVKSIEDVAAKRESLSVPAGQANTHGKVHAWNKAAAEANSRGIAELIRLDEAFYKLVKEGVDEYEPIDDSTDVNEEDNRVAEHEELRAELVRVLSGFPDNGTS